jgi:hypothetical protein
MVDPQISAKTEGHLYFVGKLGHCLRLIIVFVATWLQRFHFHELYHFVTYRDVCHQCGPRQILVILCILRRVKWLVVENSRIERVLSETT